MYYPVYDNYFPSKMNDYFIHQEEMYSRKLKKSNEDLSNNSNNQILIDFPIEKPSEKLQYNSRKKETETKNKEILFNKQQSNQNKIPNKYQYQPHLIHTQNTNKPMLLLKISNPHFNTTNNIHNNQQMNFNNLNSYPNF